MTNKNQKICIDAFKNLYIRSFYGFTEIAPCCISQTIPNDKIDFEHKKLLNIREDWLNGKFPRECETCEKNEENKLNSRRISSNNWYKDNGYFNSSVELIRLDYWVGDSCNLACVICGPEFSRKWKQELKINFVRVQNNLQWNNINLNNLRFIHFNGGEPLLNKEHIKFLEAIPKKDIVHLNYNTNGTVLPSQKLINLWSKFKLVQIDFSIDDIEDRFEYQRWPARWNVLIKNLNWFYHNAPVNCMFAVNISVGILNYYNKENLYKWLKNNFATNRVTDPVEYREQNVVGILSYETAKTKKLEIMTYLDACDKRRGTNWRAVFPELVNFINTQ